MATKCFAQVRGSVIRATRLDACGEPDPGASAVVVSKRVSTITVDEVTEDGSNIRERGFDDKLQVVDDGYTETLGYTADIQLLGVDPGLVNLLSGQPVVMNAAGDIVGFDNVTGLDLDGFGFSLEIWSRIAGSQCDPSGNRLWGYTLLPFLKGGRLGGFSVEGGSSISFTVSGAQTRDGNGWGVGPFDVDRNLGGLPAPLHTAIPANAHYRNILVSLDPPAASCGAFALASV